MKSVFSALLMCTACAVAGGPPASAGIPERVLSARMQELAMELSACRTPARDAVGSVSLTWVVERDGRAGLVEVSDSTVANTSIEGCLAGVVRRATFPAPKDEPFADAHWTVDVAALAPVALEPAAGVLGPTSVNAVLAAYQTQLASCLAMAQAGGREVTGELELTWRVDAGGRVAWAQVVTASVHDVEIERCLVSAIMTIPFPPPEGGAADLSIPLKLL